MWLALILTFSPWEKEQQGPRREWRTILVVRHHWTGWRLGV